MRKSGGWAGVVGGARGARSDAWHGEGERNDGGREGGRAGGREGSTNFYDRINQQTRFDLGRAEHSHLSDPFVGSTERKIKT